MNEFIEVPVVVSKDQLHDIFRQRFTLNSDSYQIANDVWAPGSLLFLGFAGAGQKDGYYHGVYRFRPAQPKDDGRDEIVFGGLPDRHRVELKAPKTTPKKKKDKS